MNTFHLNCLLFFASLTKSASIPPRNDTLEIIKNDVSQVGTAIENFTFDIIREMVEDEETTTSARRRRSTEDDVRQLCQKRCEENERAETQQIKDLKTEVKKLQDMVQLLKNQQKIIDILDYNATKQTREETEDNENLPNSEELAKMKTDLKNVIASLNETREVIQLQKAKDEILEEELTKQKKEIMVLKRTVEDILRKNDKTGIIKRNKNNRIKSFVGQVRMVTF